MKSLIYFFICLSAMLVASCKHADYFAFDDVEFVSEFPINFQLSDADVLPVDVIGVQGIHIFDDYLMLSCASSDGCLSVFDKTGRPLSKPFLRVGRGPGEILFQPFLSWFSFSEDRSVCRAGLYDFQGKYAECDITESLELETLVYRIIADSLSIRNGAQYFMTGSGKLICRRVADDDRGYVRAFVDSQGREMVNDAMLHLNSISSVEKNLLSTLFLFNREQGLVAELGSRLNVIQLYSLTGDFMRTISIDGQLEDIREAEVMEQENMRKVYYDGKAFDDYFVGLYLNATFKDLDEDAYAPAELHFFSWSGKPLASVKLPICSLYFDIDIREGRLYIIDAETEQLLRYDISELLSKV